MTATPNDDRASIDLVSYGKPYGAVSVLATSSGLISFWCSVGAGSMGFNFDLSPACARELAYALMEQAAAAEADDQDGK